MIYELVLLGYIVIQSFGLKQATHFQ
jgi:hypothetical protein